MLIATRGSPVLARHKGPLKRCRRAGVAALAGALVAIGACRSYRPQPLDARAIREAWVARSPSDETARQFADRLARSEGDRRAFDPADGLTLSEGEPIALVFNRDLRLARLEAGVARATADEAGRWADPVAGVDIERIISGVADPWVIGGIVELTLPISGRLAAEKKRAGAEYAAELQRLAAREWATRAALRELWIEWSAQAHRLRAGADLAERLRVVAGLAERQEQAGVLSRIDARVFTAELAVAETALIQARALGTELELRLRDLLGLAPDAPVDLVETLAFPPRNPGGGWSLDAMEAGNTELASVRSEYEVAEQALRVEIRTQYPDLTIGPGYGTDQGDDRVLLGVRVPIPLWNRNRQGVAEAEARRSAARGRYENTYEHLASLLAVARTRYEASRVMREAIEARVLPLADEQDAEVRRVAELGRVDPLLLLQAIRAQYDAKVQLVDARAAEAVGAVRLDELIGPPIGGSDGDAPDTARASPGPSEGGRP